MQKPGSENPENQQPESVPAGQADTPASRREFLRNAMGAVAAVALTPLLPSPAEGQIPAGAPFANPAGLTSKNGKLRAVMELNSEFMRSVPNVTSKVRLRYFQGWDIDNPSVKAPDLTKSDAGSLPVQRCAPNWAIRYRSPFLIKSTTSIFRTPTTPWRATPARVAT